MRQIDEILWSYPAQEPPARRYLVRRLERQPVTIDAAVPMALLSSAAGSPAAGYARLAEELFFARWTEDRFRRCGGDEPLEAGDWTRALGAARDQATEIPDTELGNAAAVALAPLAAPLAARAREGGRWAVEALRVLARISTQEAMEAILDLAKSGATAPLAMSALSVRGGMAGPPALDLVKRHAGTPAHPGMVHALRGVPSTDAMSYLEQLMTKGPALAAAVASALEGFEEQGPADLLDRLTNVPDPWAVIHAVETMGRLGGLEAIDRVAAVMKRVDHPLVRVVCLQALAASGEREAGEIAGAALCDPNPTVQAAAVEALVKLPVPRELYRDTVMSLLDTPHPKLAMNVALACTLLDPRRVVRRVKDLLGSGQAPALLQGVHCLAYLAYPQSAGILGAVVAKAPPGPLRIQAARALGRRAADDPEAAAYLSRLLKVDDSVIRQTAAWFLAGCHPMARRGISGVLSSALARETDQPTRRVLVEAIGLLGPDGESVADSLVPLLKGDDPAAEAAAYALAVGFTDTDASRALETVRGPGKAYTVLRRWVRGEGGVATLAAMLASRDQAEAEEAIRVARILSETPAFAGGTSRLSGLATWLGESRRRADFAELADQVGVDGLEGGEPTATAAQVESERKRDRKARTAYGGDKIKVRFQPSPTPSPESALPSAEEAAVVLDLEKSGAGDAADEAVKKSTYLGAVLAPPSPEVPDSPSPRRRSSPKRAQILSVLQLVAYAALAVLLGRLVRIYFFGP